MDREGFARWLDSYGRAWEQGDPDAAVGLFSENAEYFENPFGEPMKGIEAIRKYWTEGAKESQTDVGFGYEILAVAGECGIAHWWASFHRLTSGKAVDLDGIAQVTFAPDGRCNEFREWWHRKESEKR